MIKKLRYLLVTGLSLFTFLSCFIGELKSQDLVTISGYIKDASNGESLIGATAYLNEIGKGVSSNEYGFYSITAAPGKYTIEFSYLGYVDNSQVIDISGNQTLNIELQSEAAQLEEIVIQAEAKDKNVSEVEMSVSTLDINTIKAIPSLLGEVEVIRSLQLLPGVSTVGEGATGFNVRGGSIDQNLILLDEAPVFNSSHLFGFFSVFNPDAVKDVKLYKGGIPARYGGRLSSILDVRMKEGNSKQLSVNGGVGFIFSRLSVEAPIIKDKASFIVAARRSYIDILAKPFLDDDFEDSELNFYDLTLKANYTINDNNRLFISGYFGRDNFGFGNDAGFSWGNSTGTIRWNHLFSDRLFSNFTAYYSNYEYDISFGNDSVNRFDWGAGIENTSLKPEFTFFLNPDNTIKFGGQAIYYEFAPGTAIGVSEGETQDFSIPSQKALESAIYIENKQEVSEKITLNYGLRYSLFDYIGKGNAYVFGEAPVGESKPLLETQEFDSWESIKRYGNLEPRFNIRYTLDGKSSIKASYNRTTQYIHLVSNTTASTPVDIWVPSSNNVAPSIADQVALGYFRNLKDNAYELSAEVYYKRMDNLVEYIDGADLVLNQLVEGDLLTGEGRACGLELQVQKTEGKLTGFTSYTLARTERLVSGINGDEWYPSRFDQTHNFNVTALYDFNDRWAMSGNFTYISGTPTTFFNSRFTQQGYVVPHNGLDVRNNVRIPNFHRLDFSVTRKGKKKPGKKWYGEWVLSVYNVYGQRNPFSIFQRQQSDRVLPGQSTTTQAYKLSVVGSIIPSISYNFKFN